MIARLHRHAPALGCAALALVLGACSDHDKPLVGDPDQGAAEITRVGCGACHTIPGISGAGGMVGPPLDHMAQRVFIAGMLSNTPDNMVAWLKNPQAIVPGNAMPDMGLDDRQARDIAAYLATLR